MNSLIPTSKIGDCSHCNAKDTRIVKRGKENFCLDCKKKADVKKQLDRQKDKIKVRSLHQYQREIGVVTKGAAELQRWFEDRNREMTGVCKHCDGRTEKGKSDYKRSIAHILPKAYFKSIATHPDNWIELCFYGQSCHTNFDNKMLDLIELNCFDEVINKFVQMYPAITANEKSRIPQILLQYIETKK